MIVYVFPQDNKGRCLRHEWGILADHIYGTTWSNINLSGLEDVSRATSIYDPIQACSKAVETSRQVTHPFQTGAKEGRRVY